MLREDFSEEFNRKYKGDDKQLYEEHPLGPNVDEIVEIIESKRTEWKFEKIFLSTMYYESIDKFKNAFGDIVYTIDRERRPYDISKDNRRRIATLSSEENYKMYVENAEYFDRENIVYMYEMIILAKCDYFIAPHCSGSAAALVFNAGKFKDIKVLENKRFTRGY